MNETMNISSQYRDLTDFLIKHNAKNFKDKEHTHTRIGDTTLEIYGGSYVIEDAELPIFYKLYYDHIFVNKKKEYLTEKQNGNAMGIDFDFRYDYDVKERKHSKEHIKDMIVLYLEELKKCFLFDEKSKFDIFVFEKPNVNRVADDNITKDGIHMIIGIKVDYVIQSIIRDRIIEQIGDVWELPLKNSWDKVLDEGISKGVVNWQLFGSRKPGNEAYELTQYWNITFDEADEEFMMNEQHVQDFDLKNKFKQISIRNDTNPKFEMNPKIVDEYNKRLSSHSPNRLKKPLSKTKINMIVDDDESQEESISISDIVNKEVLEKAVNQMLKGFDGPNDYDKIETHHYTQILPEKYYEPGSHLLNRQVAFALKNTDKRLFLSWIMLRSKASDFDYSTIPKLYHDWSKYFNVGAGDKTLTKRSIMYWAKQDNFDEYEKIKNNTIDHYIEESLPNHTDYDIAQVLCQMYKDKYICTDLKQKVWYVFTNHRWKLDKGMTLRNKISKELYNVYDIKRGRLSVEYQQYDPSDQRAQNIRDKQKMITELMVKLKKTTEKDHIMREAMEVFFDADFVANKDSNVNLLCFNNGVIDFEQKTFRDGHPQDYITKTTKIDYKPYDPENPETKKISEEILDFMEKLFPVKDLNRYMWDHLASCLIGTNKNQLFNVYHGSGSNGKSMLTDLMSHTLGEYKGTVPISLVTEKRSGIGGTQAEIVQLKGIRYAVMQEPSKNVKLNEGIMKELTGSDPIMGRGVYATELDVFKPQFKLVVCTNNLFDIDSNDDGTWRRIRKVDFMSKFIDNTDKNEYETPHIFKKDTSLETKLPIFAPVFASMLVKRAFETEGIVEDCDTVLEASNKYRKGQDHIAAFVSENIMKTGNPTDKVKKGELNAQFKQWFIDSQGSRKMPKGQELYEYMDKKFGSCKATGWHGIKIIYPEKEDEIEEIDN